MHVLILFLCLALGAVAANAAPGADAFYAPQAPIAGQPADVWAGRWWQWLKSFARSNNPVTDASGALCTEGQVGDVWFLANASNPVPVARECTLPAGLSLFFPVLNYIYYAGQDTPITCEQAREGVAGRVQTPVGLVVSLNGEAIDAPLAHRTASTQCFDPQVHTTAKGERSWAWPGAADGYWYALKPLPPGTHTLHFAGRVRGFGQDVTYTLHVLPPVTAAD